MWRCVFVYYMPYIYLFVLIKQPNRMNIVLREMDAIKHNNQTKMMTIRHPSEKHKQQRYYNSSGSVAPDTTDG